MNGALRRIALACLLMFVVLLVDVNYLQVFRAHSLAAEPGNVRIFTQQQEYQRGAIIAAGGSRPVTIAKSVLIKGQRIYHRVYPFGPVYAPITGYDSIYGANGGGIEGYENKLLAGTAPSLSVHNLIGLFQGRARTGASIYLTIDPKAQAAAYQALKAEGRPAALVAMDPRTGAILALASYPTFDPNKYATQNGTQLDKIDLQYRNSPSQPLLDRALNATYPPGSTFKIVTSSAAFGTGTLAGTQTTVPAPVFYRLPGSSHLLYNDGQLPCGNGKPPVIFAFTESCNTAFAKIGVRVGGTALHSQANLFGFNSSSLAIPMPVSASNFPLLSDPAQIAMSSIGQFNDQVTPLQEAMLAATIANGGTLMRPYLVSQVQAPDLSVTTTTPSVLSHVTSSRVANLVRKMMISVTQSTYGTAYGTAGPPAVGSLVIAAKTGTAQTSVTGTGLDDAVFSCFAPAANPRIAVGVIVQGGGFGAAAAAPIAVKVIQAYLGQG